MNLSSYKKTRRNLKCMLTERSRGERAPYYLVLTMGWYGEGKSTENKKGSVVSGGSQGWRKHEWGKCGGLQVVKLLCTL